MRYLQAILLLVCSVLAHAGSSEPATVNLPDTRVTLTNSTLQTLQVALRVQFDSALTEGTDYELLTAEIAPLATAEVLSFSRTRNLQSGKQYRYFLDVSGGLETLSLSQQVNAADNGNSSLAIGAAGPGFSVVPQSSFAIQRHNTQFAGNAVLGFNAESSDAGDSVNYVIHSVDQKPAIGAANQLSVLSYNIWATTIYGSKKVGERLTEMPAVLAGYDVVVGTEMFDAPVNDLLAAVHGEYPYQSGVAFKAGKLMESGTRILSRWPIEQEDAYFYDACDGIQCAASRAVIYARINKLGNRYHVFATHTQSSDDQPNRDARKAQLAEMGQYIASLNLPADEPVIMAGDFNVNKIGLPEDRDYMEGVLNAIEPMNLGHSLSYDSATNHWAEAPYLEYLDYTLYGVNNLLPSTASQEIFAPRSVTDTMWKEWDLSDHYAARGVFSYPSQAYPVRPAFPYSGDIVHFRTSNGHYMRAMSGGNSFISAGSDNIGTWESFKLTQLANGKVTLQARDGHYVGLDSYLLGTLLATKHAIGAGEQFELVSLGNNRVALKADNGKFLKADFAGGAGLTASAGAIDSWETFELIRP